MGGDLQLVEALASRGGSGIPDLKGHEGGVLLNLACQSGQARVAEWLLKNQVRIFCEETCAEGTIWTSSSERAFMCDTIQGSDHSKP